MQKLELPYITELLQATWAEVKDHLTDDNHQSSLQAIETVLPKIEEAFCNSTDEVERAQLTKLFWQWDLLRCQHRYFRTHCFTITTFESGAQRNQPGHVARLFFMINNMKSGRLQLKVIIELALSLLERGFPKAKFETYQDLEEVLKLLQKSHRYAIATGQAEYVAALVKLIESTLNDTPVDYASLTLSYNQSTLRSIAAHGIVSASFAAKHGFCMTSSDSTLTDSISYLRFNLNELPKQVDRAQAISAQTQEAFQLLYKISLERGKGYAIEKLNTALLQDLLQQRLHASVVFITDALPTPNQHPFVNKVAQREMRVTDPVSLKMIKAILAPADQLEHVQQLFPTVQVIPCVSTQVNLRLDREVLKHLPKSTDKEQTLSAPDYANALAQYIQQHQLTEFMVHISRLATVYDIEHSLLSTHQVARDYFSAIDARMTTQSTRKFIEKTLLPASKTVKPKKHHSAGFFDQFQQSEHHSDSVVHKNSFG